MSRCRSCNSEIVWGEFIDSGKRAPFDAEPRVGGNVVLYPGDPPRAQVVGPLEEIPLFVSHFVTCPQAKEHRRPR